MLPLVRRNDLTNIKDCWVTEINVNNEKCFFTCLYSSPSQIHDYKTPEWINRSIKLSLKKRFKLTKRCHSNSTANNKEALDFQAKECTSIIIEYKERFIAKVNAKINNPKIVPKTYWSIINKFLTNKKTPIIPSVLVNEELVSDFERKANLFNNYFDSQCTPIENGSKLPNFRYKTEKIVTSFDTKDDDIL